MNFLLGHHNDDTLLSIGIISACIALTIVIFLLDRRSHLKWKSRQERRKRKK